MAKSRSREGFQGIFNEIIQKRDDSINGWETSRSNAKKCGEYMIHKHFSDAEKQKAQDNSKPLLRYNILISKLTTLLGNEINNRRVIRVIPQGYTEEKVVRVLDDNFQSIYEKESLDGKYIKLLADALTYPTGGWIRRYIELDEHGYNNFSYKMIDTFFIHPDPEFRNMDMSDCSYVVYDDWMSLDEIKEKFSPSMAFDTEEENRNWSTTENLINSLEEKSKKEISDYYKNGRYLVLQLEKKVSKRGYIVDVEGYNDYVMYTKEEIEEELKDKNYSIVNETNVTRIHVSSIAPAFKDVVLHNKEYPVPTERLSAFCCFSYDFNSVKAEAPSLIYILLDIQDRINKGMSQQVDFVTQALGTPWHVDAREKEAIQQLKKTGNQPNSVIPYKNPNAMAKKQPTPQVPPDIINDVMTHMRFIDDISNITAATEGRSERSGETGVLFDSKVQQSLTAINMFYENLVRTMKQIKEDYLELVPFVYDEDDRIVEVSPQGAQARSKHQLNYAMLNANYDGVIDNDVRNLKARVVLDDVANTPNRLEKQFNENIAITNMLLNSGATFRDIPWSGIINSSTIRDKEKWLEFLEMAQQRENERIANEQANAEVQQLMTTAQGLTPPTQPVNTGGA